METTPLQRSRNNLAFWRKQAEQLERDRVNLKWVGIGGLPTTLALAYFKPLFGLLGLGVVLSTYVLGLYMTSVRRAEYAYHVREAEEALRQAEAAG